MSDEIISNEVWKSGVTHVLVVELPLDGGRGSIHAHVRQGQKLKAVQDDLALHGGDVVKVIHAPRPPYPSSLAAFTDGQRPQPA